MLQGARAEAPEEAGIPHELGRAEQVRSDEAEDRLLDRVAVPREAQRPLDRAEEAASQEESGEALAY